MTTADWLFLCAAAFVAGIGCGAIALTVLSAVMLGRRREASMDEKFWLERRDEFVDRDWVNAASRRRK